MSCVTSLPDVNIHNRTLVIPEGDDELLIADASDHYRLKKILVSSLESSGGSDHHASWDVILVGETVTIASRKQMAVFGPFMLDGILLVEGSLIVED